MDLQFSLDIVHQVKPQFAVACRGAVAAISQGAGGGNVAQAQYRHIRRYRGGMITLDLEEGLRRDVLSAAEKNLLMTENYFYNVFIGP